MEAKDWLTILAALLSPLVALQVQKLIEAWKEERHRKLMIYMALMTTRHATLSFEHVRALNMIDLEFNGDSEAERSVRGAWKTYLDHLASLPKESEQAASVVWAEKRQDFLTQLLKEMGESVGYKFDSVHIKKGIYAPQGHSDDEQERRVIQRLWLEVLLGNRPLKFHTSIVPVDEDAATDGKKFLKAIQQVCEGKRSLQVEVKNSEQSSKSETG